MAGIILSIVMLALVTALAYGMWKLIFRAYVTKMRTYIPETIIRFREKRPIDATQFVINLVWSVCCIYVACRIAVMGAECIAMFIRAIMEVIRC
ncbi:MAG: hypothetical protein NC311_06725 [Muribaculaceae bacterium]|nr:hypothetical protein [Muribaculaceae bacterium]